MRELLRPLDIVLLGGERRHVGDDAHGATFRILEGEAIAAAGLVEIGRRLDLAEVGLAHAVMDRVHRLFVGRGKIDAQKLALVALMQAEDVMLVAGAAQIDRAVARRDRFQIPHLGIEALGRLQIGDAEIDAADAVDFIGLGHDGSSCHFPHDIGNSPPPQPSPSRGRG